MSKLMAMITIIIAHQSLQFITKTRLVVVVRSNVQLSATVDQGRGDSFPNELFGHALAKVVGNVPDVVYHLTKKG